jgi:hypothetical protein
MAKLDRIAIKNKFNGRCAYCGVLLSNKFHIDHVHPQRKSHFLKSELMKESLNLSINDINEDANLYPSCQRCNRWKKTFSLEEFRHEIQEQVNRLHITQAGFRLAEDFGIISITKNKVRFYFERYNDQFIPFGSTIVLDDEERD